MTGMRGLEVMMFTTKPTSQAISMEGRIFDGCRAGTLPARSQPTEISTDRPTPAILSLTQS